MSILDDSVPTDCDKKFTKEPVVNCITYTVWFFVKQVACLCESVQVADGDACLMKTGTEADLAFGEHAGPILV